MLRLSETFTNTAVLSLRTGSPIGTALEPIIDPQNLKVEGWYVKDNFSNSNLVLVSVDVRDVLPRGIVVNDHEVLSEPEELVRLKSVLELKFKLIGKQVTTESGKKIGKVSDYAIETSGLMVKKIYVAQSLIKNFSGGMVSIDRTQIIEITNRRIVVEDPTEKISEAAAAPAPIGEAPA